MYLFWNTKQRLDRELHFNSFQKEFQKKTLVKMYILKIYNNKNYLYYDQ